MEMHMFIKFLEINAVVVFKIKYRYTNKHCYETMSYNSHIYATYSCFCGSKTWTELEYINVDFRVDCPRPVTVWYFDAVVHIPLQFRKEHGSFTSNPPDNK